MNSPYMGNFRVSQIFKGMEHDGLDLVGIDSKEIHSTVNGRIVFTGWENPSNHAQGFGQYVVILKAGTNDYYFYGHLSEICVSNGETVKITDVIGIEGNTGHSTGSHLHYCVRRNRDKKQHLNINDVSGIPNSVGTYNDGYIPKNENTNTGLGGKVILNNTPIYSNSSTKTVSNRKTGEFYYYDTEIVNGRRRITNKLSNVNKKPIGSYVTGWVDA